MTDALSGPAVDNASVRVLERASIRAFVESCSPELAGDVLDVGCGLQPYRDIVEAAGGSYFPFDLASFPANVSGSDVAVEGSHTPLAVFERWDAVLCNQVIQYVPRPQPWLVSLRYALKPGGHLVLTGPTNWAEVEPEDLHRFTLSGITALVGEAGLAVVRAERRATLDLGGFQLSLGYGILARRP